MRSIKKWRHYCDFCSKAKMVKTAMVKHETGCTLNPARVCGICRLMKKEQETMEALIGAFVVDDARIISLRALAGDCPACILAAIRQHNARQDELDRVWPDFDFKAEMKSFWDDYNESRGEY